MQHDFWHERWQNRQLGFHQQQINPYLLEFWSQLPLAATSRVFVPLCGKTKDMLWLAQQGHEVIGVELSPIAVEEFFSENMLQPEQLDGGELRCFKAGNITLYQGDFFSLSPERLGKVDAVFDRASIVALPDDMRQRYVNHLTTLVPEAEMLLVAMEYDQSRMQGPPFSVNTAEIEQYFSNHFKVSTLQSTDLAEQDTHFRDKGLQSLLENVYRLTPL